MCLLYKSVEDKVLENWTLELATIAAGMSIQKMIDCLVYHKQGT